MANHRRDGDRVVALVQVLEALAAGKPVQIGEAAARVFGWDDERVFLALESAIRRGAIAKGPRASASEHDDG